ncbi:MAG: dTDP-4-dehydrorhamnose reductase [Bacteroidales bacterium]|nr:dTDP-4-dehydrorhamnose reductase [Bacteroidales bacterium]
MKRVRIDILGANGQLGSEMRCLSTLHTGFDFTFSDLPDVDITSSESLKSHFDSVRPDIVVNCAAYTAVDRAESESALAEAVNHFSVENIARLSCEYGFLPLHISTDYVFDGTSCRPYLETDPCNPVSVYGRTKRAGEEALMAHARRAVLIRTAWLYSSFGNNFVKTMLRLGQERPVVKVVFDQIGTPTYAADLADVIMRFAGKATEINDVQVFHFTNEGVCSWYDFARRIIASVSESCKVLPIVSSEYPTPVTRPHYSVLDKRKIKEELQIEIPHWEDALQRCLAKLLL